MRIRIIWGSGLKGLNIRIPSIIRIQGRGFINQGSTLLLIPQYTYTPVITIRGPSSSTRTLASVRTCYDKLRVLLSEYGYSGDSTSCMTHATLYLGSYGTMVQSTKILQQS